MADEPTSRPPTIIDQPQGAPPPLSPEEARKRSLQRGMPSPGLQKAAEEMARRSREGEQRTIQEAVEMGQAAGSPIVDTTPEYEPLTQGTAERGIYTLVGGWLDSEGKLHKEVELRAMTGHEEDLLGNNSIPITARLEAIVANCCVRFGTITDRATINQIVRELPTGTRTHMLICLRIVSYYKLEKDLYSMEVECPSRNCRKTSQHKISLSSLERYEPPNPGEMLHTIKLTNGDEVVWRGLTGRWDHAVDVLVKVTPHEALTYTILARLVRWNGEDVEIPPASILTADGKKPLIKGKAAQLIARVKGMSVADRETLRASFLEREPGIDVDIEFQCPACGTEFHGQLDVGQAGFFFPQATSMRSKRMFST